MNFDDYIQQLLGNVNPQGNMFTGLSSITSANNIPSVNNNDPFSVQNAIDARNAAAASEAANQRSSALDEMGMENARGLFEAQVLNSGGGEGGGGASSGQGPLGVGKATDAIRAEAFKSFLTGYLTGGLPGAIKSGVQKLASGSADFLGQVNSAVDPIEAWSVLQGHAPVPVVNMETPYGGSDSATQPAVTSPVDMTFSPTTPIAPLSPVSDSGMFTPASPAVASPVNMAYSPTTPIAPIAPLSPVSGGGLFTPAGPMPVDPGIQAAINAQAAANSGGGGDYGGVSYGGSTGSNAGTSNPNAYSSSSSSGSSGGGGSKIVCTAMNQSYGFGSFRNAIWLKYAAKNLTPAHEKGYHALFMPLVDIAYRKDTIISKPLRAVLENIARHRSADLRAEMRNQKRDTIGRAYRSVLEPLCFIVGKLKGY